LINDLADEAEGRLLSELAVKTMPGKALEAMAGGCLAALERAHVKGQLHKLQRRVGQPGLPAAERAQLQREMLDLELKLRHSS